MKIDEVPLDERSRRVEDIWNGFADDREAPGISDEQRRELERRLEACRLSNDPDAPAAQVIERIRRRMSTCERSSS